MSVFGAPLGLVTKSALDGQGIVVNGNYVERNIVDTIDIIYNYNDAMTASNNNRNEAMVLAAGRGFLRVVDRLLQEGADINYSTNDRVIGATNALGHAAFYGKIEMIQRLLQAGALPSQSGYALHQTARGGDRVDIFDLLIRAGANPREEILGIYQTPGKLWGVIGDFGRINIAGRLLAWHANSHDAQDAIIRCKGIALMHAAKFTRDEFVEFMLQNGPIDRAWLTAALNWACVKTSVTNVRRLIAAGADVNGNFGVVLNYEQLMGSPLVNAAIHGQVENVQILLENGVDAAAKPDPRMGMVPMPRGEAFFNAQRSVRNDGPFYVEKRQQFLEILRLLDQATSNV